MKKLKIGQIFNYDGLLWQIIRSKRDRCLECELFIYCVGGRIDSNYARLWKRVSNPCINFCNSPSPSIPSNGTIKLVSKNENARRKIREDAC